MTGTAESAAAGPAGALATMTPPSRSFASDNSAGAHPKVMEAIVAANAGHTPAYGDDPWTARCEDAFRDLFGAPVEVALVFGGTGANVVALHTLCTRDSTVICTADSHIALDEAGAPEHITGAQLEGYPWNSEGKLSPDAIVDAAERFGRIHIHDSSRGPHVVSLTQATEVGTVYTQDELAALCETAHRHDMVVHVDGARITNALAAWGFGADRLAGGCRALGAAGVDVVAFGGTKAGLLGAEAAVFINPALAGPLAERRKQATQTASKMRFLAVQFLAAIDGGAILAWSQHANDMAAQLSAGLSEIPGVALRYPVDSNAVFAVLPAAAVAALTAWTEFYVWDPHSNLVRFVASWDTTPDDVVALSAGVRVACGTGHRHKHRQ